MLFYLFWFFLAWCVWLLAADKSRWREIAPVCIFAACLALATDILMIHYPLWEYVGSPLMICLANNLAIYPVVTYLFIQLLPASRSIKSVIGYWLFWTTVAIVIEFVYIASGHMLFHLWWNILHSYIADWFLFWLFYQFHKALHLEKLS